MLEKCPEVSKGIKEKMYLGNISPNINSVSQLIDVGIRLVFHLQKPTSFETP